MRRSARSRFAARSALVAVVATAVLILGYGASLTSTARGATSNSMTIFNDTGAVFTCDFNPLEAASSDSATLGYVYEPLVVTNELYRPGVPQQYLMLASSYKWAANNRSVTFTIRKGVKWSDGQPLTAADVVFTFDLIKKYPALDEAGAWHSLSGIRQTGPYTVVASIKPGHIPGFDAIAGNTYIVPEHIWKNISNPVKYTDSDPVGIGPFKVQSCAPQLIIYTRNPDYWQKVYIDKIIYPDYTSNDAANRDMESPSGNGGFGADFIPDIQSVYVGKDPSTRTYWNPVVNNWSLFPNDKNPLLKNPLVREAISFAVNRSVLSKKAEDGFTPPAHQTGNIESFSSWAYAPAQAINGGYHYDPAKAISLLKQAGFVRGANGVFHTHSGQPLNLSIIIVGAYSDSVSEATIMSQELRAVGIQAQPDPLSVSVYGSRLADGQFTLAWSQVQGGVTPYYEYYNMLDSANSAPIGKPALSNYERWQSPKTDSLLATYGRTRNAAVQHKVIDQIETIMAKDLPVIPVVQGIDWAEWSSSNFVGWPSPSDPYINPCNYCTTDMGIEVLFTHLRPR